MTRKDELEAQLLVLRKELYEILEKESTERSAEYLGKFYKGQNNYSCPETEADYWWEYTKVLSLDAEGGINILDFAEDSSGCLKMFRSCAHPNTLDSMIEISEEEWREAHFNFAYKVLNP